MYCNWDSTRWQWSVDLHESRKEAAIYKETQYNRKTQNIQNRKQKYRTESKQKRNIVIHMSSN
jgi:hypothetical protein